MSVDDNDRPDLAKAMELAQAGGWNVTGKYAGKSSNKNPSMTIDEQLSDFIGKIAGPYWSVEFEQEAKQQLKALITESNKAFVLSVLPEKRDNQHFTGVDFNVIRGFNVCIDTIKKKAGIEAVTQPDGLRGGEL